VKSKTKALTVFDRVDLSRKLEKDDYKQRLEELQ